MTDTRRPREWMDSYRSWFHSSTNAYRDMMFDGMDRWKGAMQRMDSGSYAHEDACKDWWELASSWWETTTTHVTSFPFAVKKMGEVPSVLFVIQPPPSSSMGPTAHDPAYVLLRAHLDLTTEIKASPLVRIDPGDSIGPLDHVITVERDGPWLEIGLQDLLVLGGKPPADAFGKGTSYSVAPGHYVASVYADTPGNKISLAIVHVVVAA